VPTKAESVNSVEKLAGQIDKMFASQVIRQILKAVKDMVVRYRFTKRMKNKEEEKPHALYMIDRQPSAPIKKFCRENSGADMNENEPPSMLDPPGC
jgi:hypothetical protein